MKTTKEFKKLIEKLDLVKDEIIEEIEGMIYLREETFEERSEKWQESERGQEFESLTEDLDSQMMEFDDDMQECLSVLNGIEDI